MASGLKSSLTNTTGGRGTSWSYWSVMRRMPSWNIQENQARPSTGTSGITMPRNENWLDRADLRRAHFLLRMKYDALPQNTNGT
jgi:hypothetical protein